MVFSSQFCKIFKNTSFINHHAVTNFDIEIFRAAAASS